MKKGAGRRKEWVDQVVRMTRARKGVRVRMDTGTVEFPDTGICNWIYISEQRLEITTSFKDLDERVNKQMMIVPPWWWVLDRCVSDASF